MDGRTTTFYKCKNTARKGVMDSQEAQPCLSECSLLGDTEGQGWRQQRSVAHILIFISVASDLGIRKYFKCSSLCKVRHTLPVFRHLDPF
jgi:hypothetical protein